MLKVNKLNMKKFWPMIDFFSNFRYISSNLCTCMLEELLAAFSKVLHVLFYLYKYTWFSLVKQISFGQHFKLCTCM